MNPSVDIEALLQEPEGLTHDFKPPTESQSAIADQIVAFANAQGGLIVFGVGEDLRTGLHYLAGVERTKRKKLREQIARAARHSVDPPITVEISEQDQAGYLLILCHVPQGQHAVYQAGGRVLQRQHDENVTLNSAEVVQLHIQRGILDPERLPIPEATMADLDLAAVQEHFDFAANRRLRAFREVEEDLPPDPIGLLKARGCLYTQPDGTFIPTVAGILFFGRYPQSLLDHSGISITRFFGTDTARGYRDRVDLVGRLPQLIDQAVDYIWDHMDHAAQIPGAPGILSAELAPADHSRVARIEVPEYPLAVLRELVTNAVAHRAYENRGSRIRISIFADRLELASPGGLAGHITLENILHEQYSRNPKIVRLLYEVGFVEEEGMGLDNVYRWLQQDGRPPPHMRNTGGGFIVTLSSPFAYTHLEGATATPAPELRGRLQDRQQDQETMRGYLAQHGTATIDDFLHLFPTRARRTLHYALDELMEQGIVVRRGKGRKTYYALADAGPTGVESS